jgi:hypothetical protein
MGALTRTEVIDALPEREREAYFRHIQKGDAPASPDLNARLFKLYLMGKSLDEIQRTNKAFTLGMMVQAKIEGDWDLRKTEYQGELLDGVKDRVKQTQLESIHFVSDQLGLAHARFRDALMKYLETGDESALGGMGISNMKQYKESIDLLMQLTGQDNTKKVQGQVTHTVVTEQKPSPQIIEATVVKEIPSNRDMLALLDVPEKR